MNHPLVERLRRFIDDHARTVDGHDVAVTDLASIERELENLGYYPKHWEYNVIQLVNVTDLRTALNGVGAKGWEIVAAVDDGVTFIVKRPKTSGLVLA